MKRVWRVWSVVTKRTSAIIKVKIVFFMRKTGVLMELCLIPWPLRFIKQLTCVALLPAAEQFQ